MEKWVGVQSRHTVEARGKVILTETATVPRPTMNATPSFPVAVTQGAGQKITSTQGWRTQEVIPALTASSSHVEGIASQSHKQLILSLSESSPERGGGDGLVSRENLAPPFFSHPRQIARTTKTSGWYPAASPNVAAIPSPPTWVHIVSTTSGSTNSKSRRTSLRLRLPELESIGTNSHSLGHATASVFTDATALRTQSSPDLTLTADLPTAMSDPLSSDKRFATPPMSAFSGGSLSGDEPKDLEDATIQTVSPKRETIASQPWPFFLPSGRPPGHSTAALASDPPTSPLGPRAEETEWAGDAFAPLPVTPTTSAPSISLPPLPVPLLEPEETATSPARTEWDYERVSKSVAAIKARQDISLLAASEKLALKSTSSLRRPSARPEPLRSSPPLLTLVARAVGSHNVDQHASLLTGTMFDMEISTQLISPSQPASLALSTDLTPRIGLPHRARSTNSFPDEGILTPVHRSSVIVHAREASPPRLEMRQTLLSVPDTSPQPSSPSLKPATSSTTVNVKASPKRPLKRISPRIGSFSPGDVDPRPPLNCPREGSECGVATREWRGIDRQERRRRRRLRTRPMRAIRALSYVSVRSSHSARMKTESRSACEA